MRKIVVKWISEKFESKTKIVFVNFIASTKITGTANYYDYLPAR